MRYPIRWLVSLLAVSLTFGLAACGDDTDDDRDDSTHPDDSIIELIEDDEFSTLRTALEVAEFDEVLGDREEYTLFAPTDEAFDRLDEGVLDELLQEENRDELVELLQFHIIGETIPSDQLEAGTYETLAGIDVTVDVVGDDIFYQNAFVSDVDRFDKTKKGVVHTLEDVAIPDVDDEKDKVDDEKDKVDDEKDEVDDEKDKVDDEKQEDEKEEEVKEEADIEDDNKDESKKEKDEKEDKPERTIGKEKDEKEDKPERTILELLADDDDFSILVAAVEAAGLEEALAGDDDLTLFAPTDEAFEALDDGVLDKLLKEQNRDKLTRLLLFHVVDGKLKSADLEEGPIETLAGVSATIEIRDGTVLYEGARVSDVDRYAKNGVVHTLDDVAMIDEVIDDEKLDDKKIDDKSIYETLAADENFSTLVTALELTGLDEALDGDDELTLFAPTDEAFEALDDGVLDELLKEENRDELTRILLFHVVAGTLSSDVIEPGLFETLAGIDVFVDVENSSVFYQNAMVVDVDRFASNGVIHTLDEVAIPPEE